MSAERVHIRITPMFRKRLERLAEERHTTMSAVIKSAVMQATSQGGIPSEQEVLELLSEAARCGSVPAMEMLRWHERECRPDAAGPARPV